MNASVTTSPKYASRPNHVLYQVSYQVLDSDSK